MRRWVFVALAGAALFAVLGPQGGGIAAKDKVFGNGAADELGKARGFSRHHFAGLAGKHRLRDLQDFKDKWLHVDELAMAHHHVQQTHRGVPVFGGEAIVHLNPDGSLFAVTDGVQGGVDIDTEAALGPAAAEEVALQAFECRDCFTHAPKTDLWVLRLAGSDRLVYRVRLRREDGSDQTSRPVVFVDARTGERVSSYDDLQTATGTGTSLYNGSVSVTTYQSGSSYYLEDTGRRMGTFDMRNTTSSSYRYTDTDNNWTSTSQRAAVDAHYGAARFYDYLKNVHGRNGINGSGGPGYSTSADGVTKLITSRVHYGSNYNNAFWNGSYMTYGDGDGATFGSLVTLDICGHEMQHGVTGNTAGLVYSGESGALNESWSDVFGAMNERYVRGESANTWKIGEDAYTPGTSGDALRYMDDPHRRSERGYTANDDPDHYSERYTGSNDNGGVHVNSGIGNKAFYLLASGGSHHLTGSMTGIGADAAARIWYKAVTTYMTSGTNFAGARTATINAANALYGSSSTQATAVKRAWCMVGVGACP